MTKWNPFVHKYSIMLLFQYKELFNNFISLCLFKVIYCLTPSPSSYHEINEQPLTVWGSIWTKNAQYNSTSITKEAMRKLQVCQNKCLRLITGHDYNTSTKTLLKDSKQLSVHQLVAYHSVCQVYSISRSKLPTHHYNRLFKNDQILDGNIRTRGTEKIIRLWTIIYL